MLSVRDCTTQAERFVVAYLELVQKRVSLFEDAKGVREWATEQLTSPRAPPMDFRPGGSDFSGTAGWVVPARSIPITPQQQTLFRDLMILIHAALKKYANVSLTAANVADVRTQLLESIRRWCAQAQHVS